MPSPIDLVTLAEAQAYIGQAAINQGPKVAKLITSVSMAILASINRSAILPKTYTEVRDGNVNGGIMLRNWPVQRLISVAVRDVYALNGPFVQLSGSTYGGSQTGYLLEEADDAPAGSPQSVVFSPGSLYAGTDNVTIIYVGGYQVSSEQQTVPGVTTPRAPLTVAVAAPYGAWGSDEGVVYAASGGALAQVAVGLEVAGAYSVAAGIYTFAPADAGADVLITYGYIPEDLANACLEWVQDRLAYQDRIGLASKAIAGETTSYRSAAVPVFVDAMLTNYRNPVPIS